MAHAEADTSEAGARFTSAWAHIDQARAARSVLAECWHELCDSEGFSSSVVTNADGRFGHIDVLVDWPDPVLGRANGAAQCFASHLRSAFDDAVLAAARCVSGAVQPPDPALHRMPLCYSREGLRAHLEGGALIGVRPDQVRLLELFQPYEPSPAEVGTPVEDIRRLMRHLSTLIEPRREGGRQRVAVWAHSAAPQVEVDPPRYVASLESEGDGVLERARTVARFSIAGDRLGDVRGNPNIAFDMIFNDEPWPADPDDNLVKRSAALLATASEFIRGLERSLGLRPPIHPARRSLSHVHGPQQISWGPVDLTGSPHAAQIAEAFSSSDVSLAAHWDDEGNLTMLIKTETAVYGRPIPPALRLDPGKRQGSAAEDAALAAASIWGLPDFVLSPKQMEKGSAQREIGDGTIITDGRGLAVQVKSREAMSGNPARERNWLLKKAKEGARQAAGTVRSLRMGPTTLINGRGRAVPCDGSQVAWVRVVILDHGAPPQDIVPMADDTDLPVVTLLRRDWEFLFDQLRSVSAVVDYVHRAASDGPRPLGDEPVRYYELADADEQAAEDAPVHWIDRLGAQQSSHPILPKAPASSADVTGHAVFRVILEDIAEGPFERDETDRLQVLALLDRFSVAERAHLGRLLLEHLNDVTKAPPETTLWRSRRVIQDSGRLHLAFSACSQFTELHREAFRQWTMLRHHEFVTAGVTPEGETPWTIAVLLTPRHDGYRPWDTTMIAIHDALDLSPDEIAGMRSLWNPNSQQEPA